MEADLHRALWQAQEFGDLALREVVLVPQFEEALLLVGQRRHRSSYSQALHEAVVPRPRREQQRALALPQVVQTRLAAAPRTVAPAGRLVARDREHPAGPAAG